MRLFLFLFIIICQTVFGSFGDNDRNYYSCMRPCYNDCQNNIIPIYNDYFIDKAGSISQFNKGEFFYYITPSWSCLDQCKYVCMQNITQKRLADNLPVYKYYGHWPFIRYFGLEEPASVRYIKLHINIFIFFINI
jgi:hypothetical protein